MPDFLSALKFYYNKPTVEMSLIDPVGAPTHECQELDEHQILFLKTLLRNKGLRDTTHRTKLCNSTKCTSISPTNAFCRYVNFLNDYFI